MRAHGAPVAEAGVMPDRRVEVHHRELAQLDVRGDDRPGAQHDPPPEADALAD